MKDENEKPKVGQTVYSLNVGNAARNKKQELTPVTVTKVGRKYFYIKKEWRESKFCLNTWRQVSDYIPTERLYSSEREYKDEREAEIIWSRCRDVFQSYGGLKNIPLSGLREIQVIIDRYKPQPAE